MQAKEASAASKRSRLTSPTPSIVGGHIAEYKDAVSFLLRPMENEKGLNLSKPVVRPTKKKVSQMLEE
jgi:hypothetical protein